MRTLAQVERELKEAETIAGAEDLGPSVDNDGKVVYTPEQRRAMYARRAHELRVEREWFRKFLGLDND
jgi:hypothetical protein